MSLASPSFTELAAVVASTVETITKTLASKGLPQPSFSVDGPIEFPSSPEFAELQGARLKLIEAAQAIEQLATGPKDYITSQALEMKHDQFVLQAIAKFGIISAVPLHDEISYTDLAAQVPLTERQLRRILRHAMTRRFFAESRPGYVVHTSLSATIARLPKLVSWIGHNIDEIGSASSRMIDAIEKWGDSQDPCQTGYNIAFGLSETDSIFTHFGTDGEGERKGWRGRRFGEAMESMTSGGAHDVSHILNGFAWGDLGPATVVDVGGSVGHVAMSLAKQYPKLRFIVQDLPNVADIIQIPSTLSDRVHFEAHDFFTPQLANGADVYLLRHILHDWSDVLAIKILQQLTKGMKDGALMIIVDGVLPPRGVLPIPLERLLTGMDLQMWAGLNARERSREDWTSLLKEADTRLEITAIVQPEGSADSVIAVTFHAGL